MKPPLVSEIRLAILSAARYGITAVIVGSVLLLPGESSAAKLFGLLDTGELYASTNGGVTWAAQVAIPMNDAVALAAAVSANDLYLTSRSGSVYRSTNGGGSWAAVGATTASDVVSMTILPSGTLLILTATGTLYSSSDQGVTFIAIAALAGSDWTSLARGPLGRLYALTRSGQVAQSTDNGITWTTVASIATSEAVAIRRHNAELFVLSGTGELYRSINYGATWAAVAALTSSSMIALADLGTTLLASTSEGEVASSVDGMSWTWIGAINQLHVRALGDDTPLATGVEPEGSPPRVFLMAPRPNPSRGASVFSLSIPSASFGAGRGRLEAYDAAGRLIATHRLGAYAGRAEVSWNAKLAPGTYFVRLVTDSGRSASTKWIIVR